MATVQDETPAWLMVTAPRWPMLEGRYVHTSTIRGQPAWGRNNNLVYTDANGVWAITDGGVPAAQASEACIAAGCSGHGDPHNGSLPQDMIRWMSYDGQGGWMDDPTVSITVWPAAESPNESPAISPPRVYERGYQSSPTSLTKHEHFGSRDTRFVASSPPHEGGSLGSRTVTEPTPTANYTSHRNSSYYPQSPLKPTDSHDWDRTHRDRDWDRDRDREHHWEQERGREREREREREWEGARGRDWDRDKDRNTPRGAEKYGTGWASSSGTATASTTATAAGAAATTTTTT
eukprot:Sspe_Gene.65288::Locus_38656_Transcript_2_2_Confidence_0.600_Length_998::g.65288::m.65288